MHDMCACRGRMLQMCWRCWHLRMGMSRKQGHLFLCRSAWRSSVDGSQSRVKFTLCVGMLYN